LILGLAVSDWMIWVCMLLFILIYFAVIERMNRREAEGRKQRKGQGCQEPRSFVL
jgi:hypothetical protein